MPDPDPYPPLLGIGGVPEKSIRPRRGEFDPALERLGHATASRILVATDFDGTLSRIVTNPANALPLPRTLSLIGRLIELGVHVAVISGRSQRDLESKIPVPGVRLFGENGTDGYVSDVERRALRHFNRKAGRLVCDMPGVWLEVKAAGTSIHYRASPEMAPALSAALLPLAAQFGLMAAVGRMVIEVRLEQADKRRVMAQLVGTLQPQAVVYAGDDDGDTSVFTLLDDMPRAHLGVGVSSSERPPDFFKRCALVVEGPEGVAEFLRRLLERVARLQPI